MKILVLCDVGLNRSVVLSQQLKFVGKNDVLTAGIETNSSETLKLLVRWADKIILTAEDQQEKLNNRLGYVILVPVLEVWQIPDHRRAIPPEMLLTAQRLVTEHRDELEQVA